MFKEINWNNFCKKLWKYIILGTSDAWSMSHSSQQPSQPAYSIKDCPILRVFCPNICAVPVSFNVVSSKRAVHQSFGVTIPGLKKSSFLVMTIQNYKLVTWLLYWLHYKSNTTFVNIIYVFNQNFLKIQLLMSIRF